MSSTKWFAHCVTPEVSCARRASLNQLDILKQISKLSSSQGSLKFQLSDSSHQSETNLINLTDVFPSNSPTVKDREDAVERKNSFEHVRSTYTNLQIRRASCDPSMMQSVRPSLQQGSLLRRSSLTVSKRSPTLLLEPHSFNRRGSFCTSSPLHGSSINGSSQKLDLSRVPSLSPCVEDEQREEQFLFCSRGVDSHSGSKDSANTSCSPFLHNENFSRLCDRELETNAKKIDGSFDELCGPVAVSVSTQFGTVPEQSHDQNDHEQNDKDQDPNRSECFPPGFMPPSVRRKHSVPIIRVDKASPENCYGSPGVHEGFSLWLISHIRDHPVDHSYEEQGGGGGQAARQRTSRRSSCQPTGESVKRSAHSSSSCRRVSLQPLLHSQVRAPRKSSLHLQRLRPPAPSLFPEPCQPGRGPGRLGAVIGRGGFGTVHVAKYRGELVAVKKIQQQKAASCWASEHASLRVAVHPHLVTSLALVAPARRSGRAILRYRDDQQLAIKERETTLTALKKSLGFSDKSPSVLGPSPTVMLPTGHGGAVDQDTSICDSFEEHTGRQQRDGCDGVKCSPDEDNCEDQQDRSWLWVVSELCTPATLHSLIHSSVQLSIKQKLRFLGELCSGLAFLHSQGFVHRDVKPGNVFLSYSGVLKLGDYGCCGDLGGRLDPVIGTIPYQAPEVLQGKGGCPNSDVYSFGVTTWHVLHRTMPYQGLHPHVIAYNVTRVGLRPDSPWPLGGVTPVAAGTVGESDLLEAMLSTLARRCWHRDPCVRPSSRSLCRSIAILYLTPE